VQEPAGGSEEPAGVQRQGMVICFEMRREWRDVLGGVRRLLRTVVTLWQALDTDTWGGTKASVFQPASETHKEEAIAAHSQPSDVHVAARGQRVKCGCEEEDAGMAIPIAVLMMAREVLRISAGQAHARKRTGGYHA